MLPVVQDLVLCSFIFCRQNDIKVTIAHFFKLHWWVINSYYYIEHDMFTNIFIFTNYFISFLKLMSNHPWLIHISSMKFKLLLTPFYTSDRHHRSSKKIEHTLTFLNPNELKDVTEYMWAILTPISSHWKEWGQTWLLYLITGYVRGVVNPTN